VIKCVEVVEELVVVDVVVVNLGLLLVFRLFRLVVGLFDAILLDTLVLLCVVFVVVVDFFVSVTIFRVGNKGISGIDSSSIKSILTKSEASKKSIEIKIYSLK